MATGTVSAVLEHVRRAVPPGDGAEMTDGELLEAFISCRDQAALATLVRRHGPMVWGVCLRILGDPHDAEDAFQATFLVLVRRAASILPREKVANWLYGVAHQTALKARAVLARRKSRERQVPVMPEPEAAEHDLWNDLELLLDGELSRLPDKYREVIVLCDLQEHARHEAARQLGLPEGTVASRLARARALLAGRLAERGLVVPVGMLAAVVSQGVTSASVPPSVVSATVEVVSLLAAGQTATAGLISAPVAALTEGVLKAMFVAKLKTALTVTLAVGVLALGLGGLGASALTERTPPAEPPVPVAQDQPKQDEKPGKKATADRRVKAEETVTKSFTTKKAPRLEVETFNGPILVTTGAAGKTEVKVVKTVHAASKEAAEADLKNVDVQLKQEANVIRITARQADQSRQTSRGAAVHLQVPPAAALDLKTRNGPVTAHGTTGDVTVVTSNGPIEVKGSKGRLNLETSNGPIGVQGGSGKLELKTRNGGIDVQADKVAVKADTSNGPIRFKGRLADGGQNFHTSNGNISLTLPAGTSFRLDAQTTNGQVRCPFPLKQSDGKSKGRDGKSQTRLRATAGDNPRATLQLRTSNGNIDVRPEK